MVSIKALLEKRAALLSKGKAQFAEMGDSATEAQVKDLQKLEAELELVEAELKLAHRFLDEERQAPMPTEAGKPPPEQYTSMVEFFRDVVVSSKGNVAPKLAANQKWLNASADGFGTSIPQDGGFMVQKDFAAMMLTKAFASGAILSRVRRLTVSANSNGIVLPLWDERSRVAGSRFGGLRFAWAGEGATLTPTKGKLRRIEINLNKVIGGAYITDEVMKDAGLFDSWIAQAMNDELVTTLEDAIVNGTGAGQPLGFASVANGALVTQAIEAGQAANTVAFANLAKMYGRMPAGLRSQAVWLINQAVMQQLLALTLGGTAAAFPMFTPPGQIGAAPNGLLFGRPILELEQVAALSSAGDVHFICPSEYLLIDKGGVKQDSSIHVKFLEDEETLRIVYRAGGAPLWHTPLTPANGGETVSPFVRLAARP